MAGPAGGRPVQSRFHALQLDHLRCISPRRMIVDARCMIDGEYRKSKNQSVHDHGDHEETWPGTRPRRRRKNRIDLRGTQFDTNSPTPRAMRSLCRICTRGQKHCTATLPASLLLRFNINAAILGPTIMQVSSCKLETPLTGRVCAATQPCRVVYTCSHSLSR